MKKTFHLVVLVLVMGGVLLAAVGAVFLAAALLTGSFTKFGRDSLALLFCVGAVALAIWGVRLFNALLNGFTQATKRGLLAFYAVVAGVVWLPWFFLGMDGSVRLQSELLPLCCLCLFPLIATAMMPSNARELATAAAWADVRAKATQWLVRDGEVILFVHRPRWAAAGEFALWSDTTALVRHLDGLPPGTDVTVFAAGSILPIRGRVDEAFVARCLAEIPEGSDFTILERRAAEQPASAESGGVSHAQLRQELAEAMGSEVLAGLDPSGTPDGPNVATARIPG